MIGSYCHIDGPHDDETITDAATSVAELVRYLNHATQAPVAERTLQWAATTYRIVSNLSTALHRCDQLFAQLISGLEKQARNPRLYDDRRDRPGALTANEAADELQSLRPMLGQVTSALDRARVLTVHLGNDA
ncbi:hypothetical protein ACFWMR_02250 [Amycolatopsis thailandensis]|uniref:hypothetical protein n=1 Tax=Amycolatopsis thailandensis TaxID=589330 RepID=UPI0036561B37